MHDVVRQPLACLGLRVGRVDIATKRVGENAAIERTSGIRTAARPIGERRACHAGDADVHVITSALAVDTAAARTL